MEVRGILAIQQATNNPTDVAINIEKSPYRNASETDLINIGGHFAVIDRITIVIAFSAFHSHNNRIIGYSMLDRIIPLASVFFFVGWLGEEGVVRACVMTKIKIFTCVVLSYNFRRMLHLDHNRNTP